MKSKHAQDWHQSKQKQLSLNYEDPHVQGKVKTHMAPHLSCSKQEETIHRQRYNTDPDFQN